MALKVVKGFSEADLIKVGQEYADISAQSKTLDTKKKELSSIIKDNCEKFGTKDDKGSFYFESDTLILGKVAKKTISINQDKAVKVLNKMGLTDLIDSVTTFSVNEDKLQQAVQEGRISLEQVEDFTDIKTSYSVSVKVKEAMPEVEATTLKAAKGKK